MGSKLDTLQSNIDNEELLVDQEAFIVENGLVTIENEVKAAEAAKKNISNINARIADLQKQRSDLIEKKPSGSNNTDDDQAILERILSLEQAIRRENEAAAGERKRIKEAKDNILKEIDNIKTAKTNLEGYKNALDLLQQDLSKLEKSFGISRDCFGKIKGYGSQQAGIRGASMGSNQEKCAEMSGRCSSIARKIGQAVFDADRLLQHTEGISKSNNYEQER